MNTNILSQAHGDPLKKRLTCISERLFKHLNRLVKELIPKGAKKHSRERRFQAARIDLKRVVTFPSALNNQCCFSDIDIRTRKALKPDWGLFSKSLDPDGEMEKEKELLVKRLLKGY